ncbi:MAG: peptide ABC transporter substrate-binding protein [Arcobacter sp.]|nr:peptide ABC transporter substrate-binding protein [Arcobacter sp.]
MYKLILLFFLAFNLLSASTFREDNSKLKLAKPMHPNSHIKIFLPSIPYSYVSKTINSGLVRSTDNERGWEYDLAKEHIRVDDYTYIFELRENLKFQNGKDFTMDDILFNFEFFKKNPLLYTNIDKIDFDIIKLDEKRFKIVLKQKYEMFLTDLARIYFYTKEYIEKYNPIGAETGTATKVAGAYGMGPYILKSGFALGEKQTSKLELIANPYYWDKRYPKIKKVTVYTQLDVNKALDSIVEKEGQLDIMPIPFNKKINVLMSKYSKLIIKESTNNFTIFFNLINGNKRLENKDVRIALNEAINQENLLNFVYKKEGKISPFATSINYKEVKKIAAKNEYKKFNFSEKKKKELLNGLELNIFTQDRFIFLFKGIEYQLKKYGVKLKYTITSSEKDIYEQLLNTRTSQNSKKWDLLMWGNDDWYYQNPWTVFFIYENDSPWSTIKNDEVMNTLITKFFETKTNSLEYEKIVEKILYQAREMAYTLRVPSSNKVLAVNKEVVFKPYGGGIIPLWKIELTKDHWSIRKNNEYSKKLHTPIKTQRIKNEVK